MKKTIIALSAILLATSAFAATHATDETVANAQAGANTAKEKLHEAQHHGQEQQLKAKHAARSEEHTLNSSH
mgnify:CR=1 FL=1